MDAALGNNTFMQKKLASSIITSIIPVGLTCFAVFWAVFPETFDSIKLDKIDVKLFMSILWAIICLIGVVRSLTLRSAGYMGGSVSEKDNPYAFRFVLAIYVFFLLAFTVMSMYYY